VVTASGGLVGVIDQQVGEDDGELCGGHRDAGIRRAVVQPQFVGVGMVG